MEVAAEYYVWWCVPITIKIPYRAIASVTWCCGKIKRVSKFALQKSLNVEECVFLSGRTGQYLALSDACGEQ